MAVVLRKLAVVGVAVPVMAVIALGCASARARREPTASTKRGAKHLVRAEYRPDALADAGGDPERATGPARLDGHHRDRARRPATAPRRHRAVERRRHRRGIRHAGHGRGHAGRPDSRLDLARRSKLERTAAGDPRFRRPHREHLLRRAGRPVAMASSSRPSTPTTTYALYYSTDGTTWARSDLANKANGALVGRGGVVVADTETPLGGSSAASPSRSRRIARRGSGWRCPDQRWDRSSISPRTPAGSWPSATAAASSQVPRSPSRGTRRTVSTGRRPPFRRARVTGCCPSGRGRTAIWP